MVTTPRLTAAQREELGDARILLDSAAHNARAAQRGEETLQSLDNAISQGEQGLVTLRRIRQQFDAS